MKRPPSLSAMLLRVIDSIPLHVALAVFYLSQAAEIMRVYPENTGVVSALNGHPGYVLSIAFMLAVGGLWCLAFGSTADGVFIGAIPAICYYLFSFYSATKTGTMQPAIVYGMLTYLLLRLIIYRLRNIEDG